MKTLILDASELERAATLIQAGQLVAFPTETVYGLGASVFDRQAILSIFQVKGRPSDNPLIVHVHSVEQVAQVACAIPPLFYRLAEAFWPGPLTCVLKRHPQIPSLVSAGLESVAVRMPSHKIALELIRLVQAPLVAPSANLSGKPSPTALKHVLEDFDGNIAAVIEGGESEFGIESTVISLLDEKPVLLRSGSITKAQLEEKLGYSIAVASSVQSGPVLSPGMKYRHYAPQSPIVIVETEQELALRLQLPGYKMVLSHSELNLETAVREGKVMQDFDSELFPLGVDHSQKVKATPNENDSGSKDGVNLPSPTAVSRLNLSCPSVQFHLLSAKTLYSLLRRSDREGIEEIIVLCDPRMREDGALMNRLMKAASQI